MIIIDGYNLLWSIQRESESFGPVGDVQLCRIVDRYLELSNEKGEIIFDGTGPPDKSGFDNLKKLEVVFAGRSSDADTMIEDKIATKVEVEAERMGTIGTDILALKIQIYKPDGSALPLAYELQWQAQALRP